MNFITNPQLDLAFDYIRNTDKNIFLTGKAGTGKTTFLHQIKQEGFKRMVVTAPTGVAAINAGGMTLHSFFQLPFGLHLPGATRDGGQQRRFSGKKINLLRSIDLLVIDEISMVRADLLDAVDEVLRRYRDHTRPFGGVQLLMIGDLHQLPPVVKQDEWNLLRPYYQTPYFFGSLALQKTDPVTIELTHIYRQSDQQFIGLLNKVRDNLLDEAVLQTLNSRFLPNFQPRDEDGYITLTAHNASAQDLNSQRLEALPGKVHRFAATIKGDFPQHAYPTEETLEFKEGAQVMFVKNDLNPEKRYFNGKIGRIARIADGEICVRCKDDPEEIAVSPVDWENIKYTLDEKTKEVKEELLGTFTQYPLKLAWAITIHKSQGLTFERAIIDAQAAFAHGQVYVALSRCKSFEGIVLRTRIGWSSVKTDSVVKGYSEEAARNAPTPEQLHEAKRAYQQSLLRELFSFQTMKRLFNQFNRQLLEHGSLLSEEGKRQFRQMVDKAEADVFSLADKFLPPLQFYFNQPDLPEANGPLLDRLKKAGAYFTQKLKGELLPALKEIHLVTDNKALRKTAEDLLDNLQKEAFTKNACFAACQSGFSTHAYVRARANAELDYLAGKGSAQAPATAVPKNTPHPELYLQLLRWRNDLANDMGVETYEILPTKSLLELVKFLPADTAALKGIKGIGDMKIKHFGKDLLGLIEAYCQEKNIATHLLPGLAAPKPNTKQVSFDLFKAGKTIADIAAERALTAHTIEGHLAHFVEKGELDITELLDRDKVDEIAQFFSENNTTSTAEARAHFGEQYSYGQLRMVVAWLKAPNKE